VTSVAGALQRWAAKNGRDPKRTYVWICALCLNQHRIVKTMTPDELSAEFGTRVSTIGYLLPMLEPWRDPQYLKRAWCLFELYTAIGASGAVAIDVVLTEEEDANFLEAMGTEGYACIDTALASIQSANATATIEADLHAIRELIKSKPGGFETLDTTVRNHLHTWFEDRGAVKSARRLDRHGRKSNANAYVSSSSASLSSSGVRRNKPDGYLQPLNLNPGYTPSASWGDDGGVEASDTATPQIDDGGEEGFGGFGEESFGGFGESTDETNEYGVVINSLGAASGAGAQHQYVPAPPFAYSDTGEGGGERGLGVLSI
jgi:hypothetical protein